ncbi:MAG: flavodoxin family protein [Planctomycetota bacterium]
MNKDTKPAGKETRPPRILCLCGSPRPKGNTHLLVGEFGAGARDGGAEVEVIRTFDLHIKPCRGCLRCNLIKRCSLKGDDWPKIGEAFARARGVLFATPIYFHHVTGSMKLAIDRFRSLLHVQMVPHGVGLVHSPRYDADKQYAAILVQGAAGGGQGASGIRSLFEFIASVGGDPVPVETLVGRRLGILGQVGMNAEELAEAYGKLGLPAGDAPAHAEGNRLLREKARDMGKRMALRIQGLRD